MFLVFVIDLNNLEFCFFVLSTLICEIETTRSLKNLVFKIYLEFISALDGVDFGVESFWSTFYLQFES